jgi:hypothetical protein
LVATLAQNAHAGLIYENIGGAALIYDTSTRVTWTQNADSSGLTFTYQDANAWAAGLTVGGLTWELPTAADFTSLYTDLDPYGAPGLTSDKFGAVVPFGAGPNDAALNVEPTYWTDASGIDFNFFYGYGGSQPDANLYAAWAVEAPEPAPFLLVSASIITIALLRKYKRLGI